MKQRILGCTSLQLSELCLGTMNFGWSTDESTSLAILDAYYAHGGNFIQARGSHPAGAAFPTSTAFSEAVVGGWWRTRALARRHLVLGTRLNLNPVAAESGALREAVRRGCEDSLRRFRTDYLDLLVCEWTEPRLPPEEWWLALDLLVHHGLVRYVALAGVPAWLGLACLRHSRDRNHCRIDALQADYSLLARAGFEPETAELCREYRLGFLARSPLAGGFLIKADGSSLALARSRRRWLFERYGVAGEKRITRAAHGLVNERGCSLAQLALAWVLHHPQVTTAVIGVTAVAQLKALVGATRLDLTARERACLDAASEVQRVRVAGRPAANAAAGERHLAPVVPMPQPV